MPKPILLVDLDECIFPYALNYIPWLEKSQGINIDFPDPDGEHNHFDDKEWHFKLDSVFINDPIIQTIAPRPEALTATLRLAEDYRLIVCTARFKSSHEEPTLKWMKTHLPHFEDVIFTYEAWATPGVTKGEVMKELGAVGLIDDRQLHLDSLSEGYPGYLVNRAKPIPPDKGAKSWEEITGLLLPN